MSQGLTDQLAQMLQQTPSQQRCLLFFAHLIKTRRISKLLLFYFFPPDQRRNFLLIQSNPFQTALVQSRCLWMNAVTVPSRYYIINVFIKDKPLGTGSFPLQDIFLICVWIETNAVAVAQPQQKECKITMAVIPYLLCSCLGIIIISLCVPLFA